MSIKNEFDQFVKELRSGELDWQMDALCAQTDPEAFFPEGHTSVNQAKKVCRSCSVTEQCLKYAIDKNETMGIWGGTGPGQRLKMRRDMGLVQVGRPGANE